MQGQHPQIPPDHHKTGRAAFADDKRGRLLFDT